MSSPDAVAEVDLDAAQKDRHGDRATTAETANSHRAAAPPPDPAPNLSPNHRTLLQLQRQVGNSVVSRTIQRRPPNTGGATDSDTDDATPGATPSPVPAGPVGAPPVPLPPPGGAGGPPPPPLGGSGAPGSGGTSVGGSPVPQAPARPGPIPAAPTARPGGPSPTSAGPVPNPTGPTNAGPAGRGARPFDPMDPVVLQADGLPNFDEFAKFWNDNQSTINGVRMGLEVSRLIPGWGLLGGIAADALAGVADFMSIPKAADAPITTTLIIARDALNLVNGAAGHLLYLDQLVQDGAALSVVAAPLLAITAPINEGLSAVKLGFDSGILVLDQLIIFGSAYNAQQAPPGSPEATAWRGLVDGYVGNLMGDVLTTILDAISLASAGAAQSEVAKTGIFPVVTVLIKGGVFKNMVLPILQGAWNVWGGNAVGGVGGTGRVGDAAMSMFYAHLLAGLNSIKLAYIVGDALMGVAGDMFQQKLDEMNAVATLLLDGQDPFAVIQQAGQRALGELRNTLSNTLSMRGMAAQAATMVPGARTLCQDIKTKVSAITIPTLDLGQLESDGGIVDDVVTGVANAGIGLLQGQLQGIVDSLNSTLDMAKSAVLGPVDTVMSNLDEAVEFLRVVEEESGRLVEMITAKISDLEDKLGKCTNATDLVNMIVNMILEAAGVDASFSVAEVKAAWASIGPMIDDAIVRATAAHRTATNRMLGVPDDAPGAGGATSAPPASPPPNGATGGAPPAGGSPSTPAPAPAASPAVSPAPTPSRP